MTEPETITNPAFPVDRKVWVPQVAMIATFIIAFIASRQGLDIPAEIQVVITGLVTTAIGGIVGWLVPMAKAEIKRRMTNKLIIEAQLDPNVPAVTIPEGETIKSLTKKLAVEKSK